MNNKINLHIKDTLAFSSIAWNRVDVIYQAIINHPFNQEMILGILEQKRFSYYIEQDYLFLQTFSKSLSLIAGRLSNDEDVLTFIKLAQSCAIARQEIVYPFLKTTENSKMHKNLSFGCLAYTNYLLQISVMQPVKLAIAAILPCYWIYYEIGKHIAKHTKSNNKFKKWISTYSREEFNQNLLDIIKIFDELAFSSTEEMQYKMYDEFYKSSVLEWHFWNDAYNMKNYDSLNLGS